MGPFQPEYAISVIIDHGGSGSSKAALNIKKIMSKVFELYYQRKKMPSLNKSIIENFLKLKSLDWFIITLIILTFIISLLVLSSLIQVIKI